MKNRIASIVLLTACCVPVLAQWPKYAAPGVPRDAKGLVQMNARTPRAANGKPDLSGNWVRGDRDPLPSELAGVVAPRGTGDTGAVVVEPRAAPFPPDPNAPPLATFFDLGTNIPGGLPFTARPGTSSRSISLPHPGRAALTSGPAVAMDRGDR